MQHLLTATISALCYSLARELCQVPPAGQEPQLNRVVAFVTAQQQRMPDLLRWPMAALTLLFNLQAIFRHGACFHRLPHARRWEQVRAWKQSSLGFCRDLIRFYESLAVFGWYSLRDGEDA